MGVGLRKLLRAFQRPLHFDFSSPLKRAVIIVATNHAVNGVAMRSRDEEFHLISLFEYPKLRNDGDRPNGEIFNPISSYLKPNPRTIGRGDGSRQ